MNKKVIQKFTVSSKDVGERLDIFLMRKLEVTRSNAQRLIREGLIEVNDNRSVAKYSVIKGDNVALIKVNKPKAPKVEIIFEDNDILVIDKPAGITTHPAPGETAITIAEIFASKYKEKASTDRDMIVHRLDKGTSGLMVLVKNDIAKASLVKQFSDRKVQKTYLTLVFGAVRPKDGVIDMPLARDLVSKNRIAPAEEGKDAKTLYKVIQYYKGYSLIQTNPKTGRTHQIRVHFAAIGHPLYGDVRYGARDVNAKRIFLHAAELSFIHPSTHKRVKYVSEPPAELKAVLDKLTIE